MIASVGLTTRKTTIGRDALLAHGRALRIQQHKQPRPEQPASLQIIDIYHIARLQARDTNRVRFVVSHWSNPHWNLVFADGFEVTEDDVIEYVAWPPGWFYRPRK